MNININLEALEMIIFYWQQISERERVKDTYILELGERLEFNPLFKKELSKASFIKVLSSISNKEVLTNRTREEGKFWSNNMWMLEDLSVTKEMLKPIKNLNLDVISSDKKIELVIFPGVYSTYFIEGNRIYLNFFSTMINIYSDNPVPMIDGETIEKFIKNLVDKIL